MRHDDARGLMPDVDRRRPKVLLVGWDGVRYDVLRAMDPPTVSALARQGMFVETRMPDVSVAKTETAPGWCSILTGVWPDKHGVTANLQSAGPLERYPDVLTRVKQADLGWRTFAALGAAMLAGRKGPGPILGPGGVETLIFHNRVTIRGGIGVADERVYDDALTHLATGDPDVSFLYFGGTDQVAHASGTGPGYRRAIELQDDRLGHLLEAIAARPTYGAEDWLIVLTTDHGHRDEGGHGGDSWQERQSFVLATGGDVRAGEGVANVDIVPTVLTHLGISIDPAWGLDGRPLNRTLVGPAVPASRDGQTQRPGVFAGPDGQSTAF